MTLGANSEDDSDDARMTESSRYQNLRTRSGFREGRVRRLDGDGRAEAVHGARLPSRHRRNMYTRWDTSYIWDELLANIHVLTIHGLSDETVPSYDAIIYARALGTRSPGTHTLHMLEGAGADHNYISRQDEIVACILDWWKAQARGEIATSGMWMAGVKVQKSKL
ncbi:Peptidase-S9 domain-containing protein [Mycena chlorophos]|uniref:Peptidase-S9 domain-containing protein n=1 Tax=Mycena chlorophos TaxID=658473 RepID=A0A8H6W050_MYCCL|nr:Peptidase-S9 domain-containing protein [Mycena chlorophos]